MMENVQKHVFHGNLAAICPHKSATFDPNKKQNTIFYFNWTDITADFRFQAFDIIFMRKKWSYDDVEIP